MSTYIPITLVGNSLGERHRYLNSLVNDAYQKKVPFQSIQDAPELSPVDRLFKIDLASKLRHTEYILENLKDDDMLYVTRALKCSWLLEPQYHDVINPTYLENVLYPWMTTTAVNKMNNWLHVHLKDSSRCLEYFEYYSEKNFDLALKFFRNCPEAVIIETISKILIKIKPKHLKFLCEKCPQAVRIYYDLMPMDKDIADKYSEHEGHYYHCLTDLINTDSDLLLDIAEKYYNSNRCDAFSSSITRKIMTKHKDRYFKKPELYAAWLLHTPTLAKCLNNDEIKDIVLRLARAQYLGSNFFSYKRVEPFIKQLSRDEREIFKKMVFVDKCIGDEVKDWPYKAPSSPYLQRDFEHHVFDDNKYFWYGDDYGMMEECCLRSSSLKRKYAAWGSQFQGETLLDKLYNKYRCINFKNTFKELSKQIQAESSVQTREYMMLVLVSKTGGRVENVKELLELLVSRYNNEADNFRATIVRSLVKRARVWQLPNDLWELLLKFAHGLGLDGEMSDEKCVEGLHAVVLRSVLLSEECSPKVFSVFLGQFSTFAEYTLNKDEKRKVADMLPFMLLASAKEQAKTNEAVIRLEAVMKVLNGYSLKIKQCPEIVTVISKIAREDSKACVDLLRQLYNARFARRDLFRENLIFLQSNEAYLNVLRHDSQILMETDKFDKLADENIDHDQFLRKLAIYFSENQGLADKYRGKLEKEMAKNPRADLVRSFTILAGSSLLKQLQQVDKVTEKTTEQKRLAVALRTYGHLARPKLNLIALGWRTAGVKAVANQISTCSIHKVEEHLKLLADWPRASRLSFMLAERIGKQVEILAVIASVRPTVAIKIALRHVKQHGDAFNPNVWEIGKTALENRDLSQPKYIHLRDRLSKFNETPESLRADYGPVVYRILRKVSMDESMRILVDLEDYLPQVDEKFVVDVIQEFLDNELTYDKAQKYDYEDNARAYLILRIIAKYLLQCKSEEIQKQRLETIGKPFLSLMKTFIGKTDDKSLRNRFINYFKNFMYSLKCTDVFMDTSYVSCLPVMQHIVEWLEEILPIIKYFDIYVTMHLIMLYFKAIRQSVTHNPIIFTNKAKRDEIGVEIVGVIFGKYIAHEIVHLKMEYFESVVEIYSHVLTTYLSTNFHDCKSLWKFVSALIRGMLDKQDSTSQLLAEKVFVVYRHYFKELEDDKTCDLLEGIEDIQLNYFMKADMEDIFVD